MHLPSDMSVDFFDIEMAYKGYSGINPRFETIEAHVAQEVIMLLYCPNFLLGMDNRISGLRLGVKL
jgi:hypothetical protein